MSAGLATMQERRPPSPPARRWLFDTGALRFYPKSYVHSLHDRRQVLLSTAAGVWVRNQQFFRPTPSERVGFYFPSVSQQAE